MGPSVLEMVKKCLNEDGGFGGNVGLESNVLSTFHAIQLPHIYNVAYHNQKRTTFIISMQDSEGGFMNDKYGEKDTRFDCCAILSIRLLEIIKGKIPEMKEKVYFYENCKFSPEDLADPRSDVFY